MGLVNVVLDRATPKLGRSNNDNARSVDWGNMTAG
jgi:hypothetical protein